MQLWLSVSDMKLLVKIKNAKTQPFCTIALQPKSQVRYKYLCIVQGLSWGMKNYHGAKFGS